MVPDCRLRLSAPTTGSLTAPERRAASGGSVGEQLANRALANSYGPMRPFYSLLALLVMGFFSFLRAEPLNVGDAAPQLTVTMDDGKSVDLGEVYKKGYTLVYFYPKADTAGCTAQGCSLRDAYETLAKRGVTVIGASTDSVEAQRKFREKYNFPFPLVADTEKKLMRAFGQDSVMFASRQAFLIDPSGKIIWRDLKARTKEQAEDVLAALDKVAAK
jgi:thioredoxin-dependent peroxiredoxin